MIWPDTTASMDESLFVDPDMKTESQAYTGYLNLDLKSNLYA